MASQNNPLVSVLMPAFESALYFELALKSALLQTYSNFEIIIRDNSLTNEIQLLVEKEFLPYSKRITYIKNPTHMNRPHVLQYLLKDANGEYINYLMEDDLFDPTKIEKMMNYFLSDTNEDIKLVTSYRKPINESGMIVPDLVYTKKLYKTDTVLDGVSSGNSMMAVANWIGEPTTVLFRKKDLIEPFGCFIGHQYESEIDMASWLTLLSQGKLVYIADELSYVRIHPNRNTWKTPITTVNDWIHMIFHSQIKNFLTDVDFLQRSINNLLRYIHSILSVKQNQLTMEERNYLLQCKETLEIKFLSLLTNEKITENREEN
ncbi:glycosyltransferase family 2 protein [Bacillus cereus group sp. BfR-BA-01380]|uniref:glycosyltransferase family 2 protein n=1 Tax=Bacillus cereus group sp. BfR-BA-01380 TaxID=2920324 RepID=UPI001F5AD3F7|nr:glycosyltransferase [Bacillus cereus group sp. BfR-BA-01380]